MLKAKEVIREIADEKRVILFHSASGKDSIALAHMLSELFEEVLCVYMYIVPNLNHINRYINYAINKYSNLKFIQVPHFALYSYLKTGYLGCRQNEKLKKYTFADITDMIREKYNIEWACYGFKQSDSMNRRLMLRTYEISAINRKTKKVYPLSEYKNKDVLEYIQKNNLIAPESYGNAQSSGTNITDINYLLFLKKNYPDDLKRVIEMFPLVERLIFEYNYEKDKAE